jgi:hypothetical protein
MSIVAVNRPGAMTPLSRAAAADTALARRIAPGIALAALLCVSALPAQAQIARTFVSAASGSDLNNCDRPTPCRTFQRAHDQTLGNGEITVLDPGGYGAVTINRTISIINDGVGEAGALVSGGGAATGITISAGATDAVNLRGITVKGIGFGGGKGIRFNTGKSLTIENCVVRNLTNGGISFFPTGGASSLAVTNTIVSDTGDRGIHVLPVNGSTVTVNAVVSRSEVYNTTGIGIFAQGTGSSGTINMTVIDSVSAGATQDAMRANSLAGAITTLTILRSLAAGSNAGITSTNPNATVRVSQSFVTGNAHGWFAENGGTLQSFNDNVVVGNGADEGLQAPLGKK